MTTSWKPFCVVKQGHCCQVGAKFVSFPNCTMSQYCKTIPLLFFIFAVTWWNFILARKMAIPACFPLKKLVVKKISIFCAVCSSFVLLMLFYCGRHGTYIYFFSERFYRHLTAFPLNFRPNFYHCIFAFLRDFPLSGNSGTVPASQREVVAFSLRNSVLKDSSLNFGVARLFNKAYPL